MIQSPEECSEGFSGAGWGMDEGVFAVGDCRPTVSLGLRRLLEGSIEPTPGRGGESVEYVHDLKVSGLTDKNGGEMRGLGNRFEGKPVDSCKLEEDIDDCRVELGAGVFGDLRNRKVHREGRLVSPCRRHRIESVGNEDDP